ncbi:hypothetical protein [Micromonospora tarensis]|uniref:Helix-turn-helix domain-containing protein n=1 Tax=Micromonospora tarensis TaxID=2806100 RepID=A0ABS1YCQ6_9ACTN|nr:hypothetical protein [Micromonospora tarensis]MBM0275145.1 hypothetical protein [Micromonospora tarensis]
MANADVVELDPETRFVSVERARRLLGDVTYRQIGLMVQRKELRSCKLGRRRLIELASINEVLDEAMEKARVDNGKAMTA